MKMAKFSKISNSFGQYLFECPGCKYCHSVWTDIRDGVVPWNFNGDTDKPTVSPSLLVKAPYPEGLRICHSFIKDGFIQYLSDCTHELAGQTVELPEIQ